MLFNLNSFKSSALFAFPEYYCWCGTAISIRKDLSRKIINSEDLRIFVFIFILADYHQKPRFLSLKDLLFLKCWN